MAKRTDAPPVRDAMLRAVTEAMVELHERYHGRRPLTARSQMMGDDMLACLLGDMYTDIEKTMIELDRTAAVHQTRSLFQQAMKHRFINELERITGRSVTGFMSTHHVGPDLEINLFTLAPMGGKGPVLPS